MEITTIVAVGKSSGCGSGKGFIDGEGFGREDSAHSGKVTFILSMSIGAIRGKLS